MDADDLRPVDELILDELRKGQNNAPNIAEAGDYSTQYVRERLGRLREDDLIEAIGHGVYRFVSDPRDTVTEEDEDR